MAHFKRLLVHRSAKSFKSFNGSIYHQRVTHFKKWENEKGKKKTKNTSLDKKCTPYEAIAKIKNGSCIQLRKILIKRNSGGARIWKYLYIHNRSVEIEPNQLAQNTWCRQNVLVFNLHGLFVSALSEFSLSKLPRPNNPLEHKNIWRAYTIDYSTTLLNSISL